MSDKLEGMFGLKRAKPFIKYWFSPTLGGDPLKQGVLYTRLEQIIKTIEIEKNLPLDIKEIHVFGSFARGKESPGDLDLMMVHEQLTDEQTEQTVRAIQGYATSLEQQMNGRLKSNRENIDIAYGASLEEITSRMRVKPSLVVKLWSKDDHNWSEKLIESQSNPPDEKVAILEKELEHLREYTRRLEHNLVACERGVANARLGGPDLTRVQQARIAAMEELRKTNKMELFILL
jgi:predicted nucleotidyltransferase